MLNVLNPATGETIAEVPVSTPEDVDRAVAAARSAFGGWSTVTPYERQQALLKLAAGRTSFIRREAVGVVAQITPENHRGAVAPDPPLYPLMMAILKIGPALATGNTIVLKPAETTPLSTLRLVELANEILPPGVLNVITGAGEVGQRMVTHPGVDMVSLTGSVNTGKWIAKAAADTLKRVHLELGGKAPVVVFDDADLDALAETVTGAAYYNAGQDCTAATRVLASERLHDDVVEALAEHAKTFKLGDTFDPETTLGPVNSARQLGNITGFLERRPDHARIVTGGQRPDSPGFFLINDHLPFVSEMPHGGFKQSGYGKDLSMYGVEDYTVVKHVMASLS